MHGVVVVVLVATGGTAPAGGGAVGAVRAGGCRERRRGERFGRRPLGARHHEVERARTDRPVFTESVRDVSGIYPHGELGWEVLGDVLEARGLGCFAHNRVHL